MFSCKKWGIAVDWSLQAVKLGSWKVRDDSSGIEEGNIYHPPSKERTGKRHHVTWSSCSVPAGTFQYSTIDDGMHSEGNGLHEANTGPLISWGTRSYSLKLPTALPPPMDQNRTLLYGSVHEVTSTWCPWCQNNNEKETHCLQNQERISDYVTLSHWLLAVCWAANLFRKPFFTAQAFIGAVPWIFVSVTSRVQGWSTTLSRSRRQLWWRIACWTNLVSQGKSAACTCRLQEQNVTVLENCHSSWGQERDTRVSITYCLDCKWIAIWCENKCSVGYWYFCASGYSPCSPKSCLEAPMCRWFRWAQRTEPQRR